MKLPVIHPPFEPKRDRTIAGILLAAGTSSRFGDTNKLLTTINGTPIVCLAAHSLVESLVDQTLVVLGYEAARVRSVLSDFDVEFVENPAYAEGQATSVATAVRTVTAEVDAAVFALGDMPFVETASINSLIEAYLADAGNILAAAVDGERGNPVLFDARYFAQLQDVDGDTGGRRLILESPDSKLVETGDPGVRRDIDVPTDLED